MLTFFKSRKNIPTILFSLLIFLAPLNLFLVLSEEHSYVNGLIVDYLLPKVYLVDLIIIWIIGWKIWEIWSRSDLKKIIKKCRWLVNKFLSKKKSLQLAGFLFILASSQFLAGNVVASIWYSLVLIKVLVILAVLKSWHKKIDTKFITFILCLTVFAQSLLGWYQFIQQESLFPYRVLGETNLSQPFGLARGVINNGVMVLPYGTTPHPNILAGMLVIYALAAIFLNKNFRDRIGVMVAVAILSAASIVFLTQSLSAGLTLVLGIGILSSGKVFKKLINYKKLGALLLAGLVVGSLLISGGALKSNHQSFVRRHYLNRAAWQMWVDHPVTGVGLNNFTTQVEEYAKNREVVRFVQPAHNLAFLWLAETGLVGMGSLVSLMYWLKENHREHYQKLFMTLLLLLPIVVFDHYLLTQQMGMVAFISLFLILNTKSKFGNFLEKLFKEAKEMNSAKATD